MNRTEFDIVKKFTYNQYCEYLKTKYGLCVAKYGSIKNRRPGLFIHHIGEDTIPSLSNPKVRKEHDLKYQAPDMLCYCDYLEHLLLHIMIGRVSDPAKHLGLNGPCQYIIPGLISFYKYGARHPKWDKLYYTNIENDYDVFKDLLNEYNELVKEIDLVLEHNVSLYEQVANSLDIDGKALAELGTGLGKTTLALQYVKSHNCRALVICPNNTVKEGWTRNGDWTKPITFAGLAALYNHDTNSFSKDILNGYGLVIIDEVHHAGYDEDTGKGAAAWGAAIKYVFESGIKVLGLSATPVRTDGIDVGEQYFKDCTFQGFNFETAIEQGIVHPLSYITSIYDKDGITKELKGLGWHSGSTDPARMKLEGQLDVALNNIPEVVDILTTHISQRGRKGLVFVQEESDSDEAISILTKAFPNSEIRKLNSHMSEKEIKENRAWFADEKTTEGYLVVINMVSEGAHYPGVNTGIIFRRTDSYVLLTQMLGRFSVLTTKPNPDIVVIDLVNNLNRIKYNDRVKDTKKQRLAVDVRRALMKTAAAKSGQIIVKDYTQNFVERMRELKEYCDDSWEDWEIEIIQKYYATEGAVGCQKRIDEEWELRYPGSLTKE